MLELSFFSRSFSSQTAQKYYSLFVVNRRRTEKKGYGHFLATVRCSGCEIDISTGNYTLDKTVSLSNHIPDFVSQDQKKLKLMRPSPSSPHILYISRVKINDILVEQMGV